MAWYEQENDSSPTVSADEENVELSRQNKTIQFDAKEDSSLHNTKSQKMEERYISDCNLEVLDDNSDVIGDDNCDDISFDDNDNYLEGSEDFELKDLEEDDISVLQSVLSENTESSLVPEINLKVALSPDSRNETEEDDDVDSEEEKSILKEIRDEIENKVREEMKDKLSEHKKAIVSVPRKTCTGTGENVEVESLQDMDPKLLEAMIKMKKLDKILMKKMERELEVKRNRLILEKRMRQEIIELTKGVNVHRDIKINTEKFLALEPPPSHNEGVTLVDIEEDLPPLFQTQVRESDEVLLRKNNGSSDSLNEDAGKSRTESTFKKNSRPSSSQATLETKDKKRKKDFIKRNKELAANADQSIPMTDDEKKRLGELLEGVDELSEPEESHGEDNLDESSAHQISLCPGEGYCPDNTDMESLTDIDEKLKALMPQNDYLLSVQRDVVTPGGVTQQLFSRVGMHTNTEGAGQQDKFGEQVLHQAKDERDLKARLQSIEEKLDKFRSQNEDGSDNKCHLTAEQLDSLLDQCAQNMATSRCTETPGVTARSVASSRLSLLENPPKLNDEQLQKLLSEAHFPLSSRLLALVDDDDNILEGGDNAETIRAETWKAIKDVKLDEHCVFDVKSLSQSSMDNDLQNCLNITDNVALNVSNNHNRNIFTNNNETNNHSRENGEDMEDILATSPAPYTAFDLIQSSVYSGSVTSNMHGTSGGLPRISQSNGISRTETYLENRSSGSTPIFFSRDNPVDTVRLPNISTKSFLVHAQQGMNNAKEKDRIELPTRQQLQMVRNELSDLRVDSVSGDKDGASSQGCGCKSTSRTTLGCQPRPPLPKDWQSKV